MKNIFISVFVLFTGFAFAQTPTQAKSAGTTTTAQTTSTELSAKAKSLCKNWTLTMTENFAQQHQPTDTQKNDQLVLMDNGMYRMTKDGNAQTGTWTLDKSNVWLTLTRDDGTVMKLKVVESTATTLKIDYRDSDDIHNFLYYSAK